MTEEADKTYVLTAELDANSFDWLDGLRRLHFPAERNWLPAHLTMFHRLSLRQVEHLLCATVPLGPIPLEFDGMTFLGSGSAVRTTSSELEVLRQDLKTMIGHGLSRQDDQKWKPHVTIQNKVPLGEAHALFRLLDGAFVARAGDATGLLVWEYIGGPWQLAHRLPFGK